MKLLILWLATSFTSNLFAVTHAPLHADHIQVAEEFIQSRLKTQNHFDLIKLNIFLKRLVSERDYFLSNLYETKLIEQIELQLNKPSKVIEEAREELDQKKSDHAIAYNSYLIPRIEKLIEEVEKDSNCKAICDVLVDEFIFIYAGFYAPNKYRNYFRFDAHISQVFNHRQGYNIPVSRNLHANNLIVGESQALVNTCLKSNLRSTDYLTQEQLEQLKKCGFDLSLLNPGKSMFWHKPETKVTKLFDKYDEFFPAEEDKIYYREVKFSGKGSPKISGYFKKGKKKRKIKVKIGGKEPNTENFTARIGRLLGLAQDPTRYRERVQIYFKDIDDYNEFQTNFYRKYRDKGENFIESVEDWKEGKKISVRYASLEISPKDVHKLNAPDVFGWDHKNRREFRGILLWMGFANIVDLKNANWRVQLRETDQGLKAELSMQDVGFSMGKSFTFDDVLEAAEMEIQDLRNVNGFENSFVTRRNGSVNIKWNDFMAYSSLFETTTFDDLKWMARKIADITVEDFQYVLRESGFSRIEQELYLRKLGSRRDEMIKVFGLDQEYAKFNLPPASEYQVEGKVKNGFITAPNLNSTQKFTQAPAIVYLGHFLNQRINLNAFNSEIQLAIGNELGGDIDFTLDYNLVENKNFSVFVANPGIEVGFVREIRDARFIEYSENDHRQYYAVDRYSIGFFTESGVTGELSKLLPVELRAQVNHFKLTFDHYRPFQSVYEAATAKATLLEIMPAMKDYILNMGRNEYITYANETGLEVSLEVGEGQHYRVEVGHERIRSNPITFTRNQYGEFEVFQEKVYQRRNYVELSLGVDIPLFYIPIIGVEYNFMKFQAQSKLYAFELPSTQLDDAIKQNYMETDLKILNDLIDGEFTNPLLESKVKYNLKTEGSSFSRRGFLSLLLGSRADKIYYKTVAKYRGSENRTFHRYYMADQDTIGLDNTASAHLLWSKDKATVEVQVDEEDPLDFVIILNNFTFRKNLTKYGLEVFLDGQNHLYSQQEDFFIKDILPPTNEVNDYKKIMSHVRVFLYAKKFLERIDKLYDGELNAIIQRHMARGLNPVREVRARTVYNNIRTIRTILRQETYSKKRLVSLLAHTVKGLNTQDFGVQVLSELFGENNMFVMGEVYGILTSFSFMQDGTSVARRRFAGRSWGKYRKRPPFWKYLTDFPIMVRPGMIPYRIDEELFLPVLPTGQDEVIH